MEELYDPIWGENTLKKKLKETEEKLIQLAWDHDAL